MGEVNGCLGADAPFAGASDEKCSAVDSGGELGDYGLAFCAEAILR